MGIKAGRKLLGIGVRGVVSACVLMAWQIEVAQAHTVSIGYESSGPGAVTFWFGTYHSGVTYTEGSLQLVGGTYSSIIPFSSLVFVKPTGLIDGTTNFYSNGTALVGSFAASAYQASGPVIAWQGASFTGLRAGTYTFTYLPIAVPTSVWQPEDTAILSYTVDLSGALLGGTQLSPFAGNTNQRSVAGVFDAALAAGASNAGLTALGSMSAQGIANALTQASGESAAGARQAAIQVLNPFLRMMVDPFVASRDSTFGAALGFAPERPMSPAMASAYAAVAPKSNVRPESASRWSMWGGAFGGENKSAGDVSIGSHDTGTRTAGVASGFDYRVNPATVVGFALGGGSTSWGLSDNLGGGRSDVFQSGLYGSTRIGDAYLSGSLALALHSMSTDRTVAISGLNNLSGSFNAQSYGGRLEGGYRFTTPSVAVTPYAAVQVQAFHMPSYSETGAGDFALTYGSQNATDTRSEIGAWVDQTFAVGQNDAIVLRGRAAWAHDWVTGSNINAVFQSFSSGAFTVTGAATAPDSLLVSTGAELKLASGLSFGVKFDGEFASTTQTYGGTGTVRYSW